MQSSPEPRRASGPFALGPRESNWYRTTVDGTGARASAKARLRLRFLFRLAHPDVHRSCVSVQWRARHTTAERQCRKNACRFFVVWPRWHRVMRSRRGRRRQRRSSMCVMRVCVCTCVGCRAGLLVFVSITSNLNKHSLMRNAAYSCVETKPR